MNHSCPFMVIHVVSQTEKIVYESFMSIHDYSCGVADRRKEQFMYNPNINNINVKLWHIYFH